MTAPAIDPRPSPIAGQWYPADRSVLAGQVDGYLAAAELPALSGQVVGVVAPHAGHRYSGPVAAHAFAALRGRNPGLVAVVSPMHHPYYQPLLTTAHDAYRTPLGDVSVDQAAVQALDALLREKLGFGLAPIRQDPEHSLEIELPFLQRALPGSFNLLPVMLRDQTPGMVRELGECLGEVLADQESLLVASSDLSHFYTQAEASELDQEMLRRLAAFDPEAVLSAEEEGAGFACGRGAVAAVLWAARRLGADQVRILRYATSGDVTGDLSGVVGYGAAAILKSAAGA